MSRALAAAAAATIALLTGCSVLGGGDGSTTASGSDFREVSTNGVAFEVPRGWEDIDAEEMAEGSRETAVVKDLADRMGMTPQQFERMMGSVDLFLFSDRGARRGFLDNINVVGAAGAMPNDSQLKRQMLTMGAKVHEIGHEQTGVGDATTLSYTLAAGGVAVQGEAVFVDVGDGPVTVTVSTTNRDWSEELLERILETLGEAS